MSFFSFLSHCRCPSSRIVHWRGHFTWPFSSHSYCLRCLLSPAYTLWVLPFLVRKSPAPVCCLLKCGSLTLWPQPTCPSASSSWHPSRIRMLGNMVSSSLLGYPHPPMFAQGYHHINALHSCAAFPMLPTLNVSFASTAISSLLLVFSSLALLPCFSLPHHTYTSLCIIDT